MECYGPVSPCARSAQGVGGHVSADAHRRQKMKEHVSSGPCRGQSSRGLVSAVSAAVRSGGLACECRSIQRPNSDLGIYCSSLLCPEQGSWAKDCRCL